MIWKMVRVNKEGHLAWDPKGGYRSKEFLSSPSNHLYMYTSPIAKYPFFLLAAVPIGQEFLTSSQATRSTPFQLRSGSLREHLLLPTGQQNPGAVTDVSTRKVVCWWTSYALGKAASWAILFNCTTYSTLKKPSHWTIWCRYFGNIQTPQSQLGERS